MAAGVCAVAGCSCARFSRNPFRPTICSDCMHNISSHARAAAGANSRGAGDAARRRRD
jgi:hypothetical protein